MKMEVDVVSLQTSLEIVCSWVNEVDGRYVCVSNVHMCMEVYDNQEYEKAINNADLIVPDGRPLVWAQKALGYQNAEQVRGTDLTLAICQEAQKKGYSVGFYGSTPDVLTDLEIALEKSFPELDISYTFSPPFRALSTQEIAAHIDAINQSGVDVLFVGLGCPKQEKWMSDNSSKLYCVALGVGAAFDFITANKKDAPQWMQKMGLEWLFRLLSEPRRLWKRYLKHNPRFIWYFLQQLMGRNFSEEKNKRHNVI